MEVPINKWPAAYHLEFSQLNRHSAVSLCLQPRPFSHRFATPISKFLGRFDIQASEGQGAGLCQYRIAILTYWIGPRVRPLCALG